MKNVRLLAFAPIVLSGCFSVIAWGGCLQAAGVDVAFAAPGVEKAVEEARLLSETEGLLQHGKCNVAPLEAAGPTLNRLGSQIAQAETVEAPSKFIAPFTGDAEYDPEGINKRAADATDKFKDIDVPLPFSTLSSKEARLEIEKNARKAAESGEKSVPAPVLGNGPPQ